MRIREFFELFPSDEACLEHLMASRFNRRSRCPNCRKISRFHRVRGQRCYSCQRCGHHIHPCAGTAFHRSRTPLQLWFYAIYLFSMGPGGVSARELQRRLGVTYKTAWRMRRAIGGHARNGNSDGAWDPADDGVGSDLSGERPA